MTRTLYVFGLSLALLLICIPGFGQGQAPVPEQWVDYVNGDYDVLPNITYSVANNTELKLDLYLPKNRSVPKPTLILFHGGGWVDGQKERNVLFLLPYLAYGWAAVNVEYRMARNSPAPAAVEDCRCALRWLTYHAKEYNLDPSKFVLTGTSAGGHLALITGMLPAHSVFDRQCPTDSRRSLRFTVMKMMLCPIPRQCGCTQRWTKPAYQISLSPFTVVSRAPSTGKSL